MQSPTVFVVADDPAVLNLLTDLFEQAKLYSKTFASAEVFLAEFAPEDYGCLLLDMSSAGMSGAELHRMLVQRQSIIPVIILTNLSNARSAMEMLKGGALDFFEKPFDSGALLVAVKHAIEVDAANRYALLLRSEVLQRFAQLTKREREILGGILESKSSRELAGNFEVSARTVEAHRAKIMKKMGAVSLVKLASMVATAFGCHCIHKHKHSQSVAPPSNIPPFQK